MKISKKMLLAGSLALFGGFILFTRRSNRKNRLTRIADEGYETAHDILFPEKYDNRKVHYGPVIPSY